MNSVEKLNTIISASDELTETCKKINDAVSEIRIIGSEQGRLDAIKDKFARLPIKLETVIESVTKALEDKEENK